MPHICIHAIHTTYLHIHQTCLHIPHMYTTMFTLHRHVAQIYKCVCGMHTCVYMHHVCCPHMCMHHVHYAHITRTYIHPITLHTSMSYICYMLYTFLDRLTCHVHHTCAHAHTEHSMWPKFLPSGQFWSSPNQRWLFPWSLNSNFCGSF